MTPPNTRPTALSQEQITKRLGHLNEVCKKNQSESWSIRDQKLCKIFLFQDFIQAIAFMSGAVEGIETLNHHPEWKNVYNRLEVELITHDVASQGSSPQGPALTTLDFELAEALEASFNDKCC